VDNFIEDTIVRMKTNIENCRNDARRAFYQGFVKQSKELIAVAMKSQSELDDLVDYLKSKQTNHGLQPEISRPRSETPKPPLMRVGCNRNPCPLCGSGMKPNWLFFKSKGCYQSECENYWRNK